MKALSFVFLCTGFSIFAEPICFYWSMTANGSFGGQSFSNQRVTVGVFADTSTVTATSVSGPAFVVVENVGTARYLADLTMSRDSQSIYLNGLLGLKWANLALYNFTTNRPFSNYLGDIGSSTGTAMETTAGMVSFRHTASRMGFEGKLEPHTGPLILSGTQELSVVEGESPVLSVSVGGTRPYGFQWRKNGVDYDFRRMPLALTNVSTADSGEYEVVVKNAFGEATSEKVILTVNTSKPVVTLNPVSQGGILGTNLDLEAQAVGTPVLSWQWYFGNQLLEGQTSNRLTLTNITEGNLGEYHAVVSNTLGSAETAKAMVDRSYIHAWGRPWGPLPLASSNIVSLTAGDEHFLAMRSDGTVSAFGGGDRGENIAPAGLSNVVSIAAGSTHSLVSRENGSTAIWGSFFRSRQNEIVPEARFDVAMVGMGIGSQHAVALKRDGTVVPFGGPYETTFAVPEAATNIVSLAAGAYHIVALRADGRVFSWGGPNFSATNTPSNATGVVAVTAGWHHSLALRADGRIVDWGLEYPGFNGSNYVDIASLAESALALRSNGQVVYTGNNLDGLAAVPKATTNAAAVAGGSFTAFALMGEGKPAFTTVAMDRRVPFGTNAYFRMRAIGAHPTSYQWKLNGVDLPGRTNAWLVVTNTQPADVGIYTVTATNSEGSATSRGMGLNVARVEVFSAGPNGNGFAIGVRTTAGIQYAVEFKDDLEASEWILLEEKTADSESLSFTDASGGGGSRFYRVRRL
jgi:hypothetical protein